MILGVTGMYASGKDTIAEFLQGQGFIHYSLSDEIRQVLQEKKKKITRDNLIAEGNFQREAYGSGVLAERVKLKLHPEKNYVITSIRNPAEVHALKQLPYFTLLAVEAPQERRFNRLKARARENDPQTFKDFVEKEKIEQSSDPTKQQLQKTIKLAKVVIQNAGTIEDLQKKVQSLLYNLWRNKERPSFPEIYLQLAHTMAQRSTCLRLQVGTVITSTDFRKVLAVGYNGNASGLPNECDRLEPGNCGCVHSEENAVINCDVPRYTEKFVFVTHIPCVGCAKRLINLGNVKRVFYINDYRIRDSLKVLNQVGIKTEQIAAD